MEMKSSEDISSLALSPDNTTVASISDKMLNIWDTNNLKHLKIIKPEKGIKWKEYQALTFSPDGRYLLSFSRSGPDANKIWDVNTGQKINLPFKTRTMYQGSFDQTGSFFAVPVWDYEHDKTYNKTSIAVFDLNNLDSPTLIMGEKKTRHIRFHPNREYLYSIYDGKYVSIWDIKNKRLISKIEGHEKNIIQAELSPQGDKLITVSPNKIISRNAFLFSSQP